MPRQIVTTSNAPSSPLFSQGVRAGSQLFISGTVGIDVSTARMAGDDIQAQTRQALANCEAILREASATLDDVVEVGVATQIFITKAFYDLKIAIKSTHS